MKDKTINVESSKIKGEQDIVVNVFVSIKNNVPVIKTYISASACEEGTARVVVTTHAETETN